jgi:hypothetical protein
MHWRCKLAEVAGFPPLRLMEGFFEKGSFDDPFCDRAQLFQDAVEANFYSCLPIKWDCLKEDPIHELLYHSDCDGEINWERCGPIADSLEKLIPLLPEGDGGGHVGNWREKTQQFVDGLRDAFAKKENVDFH